MKTYTMEVDGEPALAFRAKDDQAAATFPEMLYSPTSPFKKPSGTLTVRPATITEREVWTRKSVEDTDDDEDEHDHERLVVFLDEDFLDEDEEE
jgi:hypothetical protein